MNPKTIAIALFVAYYLMMYGFMFIRPRKCSEHETPEEKYKYAVRAPFTAALSMGMAVAMCWAVIETWFRP